jgi:hypothetical protein
MEASYVWRVRETEANCVERARERERERERNARISTTGAWHDRGGDASVDEGTSSAVLFERVRERGAQRVAVENELGERRHVAKLGRERGQPAERVGERCESKEVTPTRYRRR